MAPDLVIASGDLTNRGRRGEHERAAAFLRRLGPPVLAVPGNHDIPYTFPARFTPPKLFGKLPTLPLSLLRIDYVYHSRHWSAASCEVGGRDGSDHRPVFAELELTSPEPAAPRAAAS